MAALNLAGQRFGRMVVIRRDQSTPSGRTTWLCRCDCGNERIVRTTYLTTGDTRSCGCLHSDLAAIKGRAKAIDLTGQRFGRLLVRERKGCTRKGDIQWSCDCDCGQTTIAIGWRLRNGKHLSCGCLRDELMRARAAAVGSARRIKACRTCGKIYEAIGPQKECSGPCRRRWHAADVARQRQEERMIDLVRLGVELNRRL